MIPRGKSLVQAMNEEIADYQRAFDLIINRVLIPRFYEAQHKVFEHVARGMPGVMLISHDDDGLKAEAIDPLLFMNANDQ